MSSNSRQYLLFGFSPELNWRPLTFVSPIPPARICSACGMVHETTGSLLCGHLLCKMCYERCLAEGACTCPLDGDVCPVDGVLWRSFPAENLARRQVKCWNEPSGCNVITAASDIFRHFCEDCEHHTTRCPKCSATVLRADVCPHLMSCDGGTEPTRLPRMERAAEGRSSQGGSSQDVDRAHRHLSESDEPSGASLRAELRAMKAELGRALESCAEIRSNHEKGMREVASLKAALEKRTVELKTRPQTFLSSHDSRLNELDRGSRGAELNQINEQLKRSQKEAAELKKETESCRTELAALKTNLEAEQGKIKEQVSDLTSLHSELFEKCSNLVRLFEDTMAKQLELAAGGDNSSARSAVDAGRNVLDASGCSDAWENQTEEEEEELAQKVAEELATVKASLENQLDSVKVSLGELSVQNTTLAKRLNKLSDSVDVLVAWKGNQDDPNRNRRSSPCNSTDAVTSKNAASGKPEGPVCATMAVLRHIAKSIECHSWMLKGLKDLKKKATKTGEASHVSESVYLRGYCVSPGVVIKMQDGLLWLHFSLHVHKGLMDDGLRWPFEHGLKFSIIHPDDNKLEELRVDSPNGASVAESGGKSVMNFYASSFHLVSLEQDGYIKNNQLILKLELLSGR